MTRKLIDKYFSCSLGQQCDVLYSTADNRVFIRYEEALRHTKGELDNTKPLKNKTITVWDNLYTF